MNAHCGANTYTAGKKTKLVLSVLNGYFVLEGLGLKFRQQTHGIQGNYMCLSQLKRKKSGAIHVGQIWKTKTGFVSFFYLRRFWCPQTHPLVAIFLKSVILTLPNHNWNLHFAFWHSQFASWRWPFHFFEVN